MDRQQFIQKTQILTDREFRWLMYCLINPSKGDLCKSLGKKEVEDFVFEVKTKVDTNEMVSFLYDVFFDDGTIHQIMEEVLKREGKPRYVKTNQLTLIRDDYN